MSPASFEFVLFFLAILFLGAVLRGYQGFKWLLLAASLIFYLSWSLPSVLVLLWISLADYVTARKLGRVTDRAARKRLLWTSILCNLLILCFFKYINFLVGNLCAVLNVFGCGLTPPVWNIVLPPGISFFTFASLSYVIDVYNKRLLPCTDLRDYTLFVSFFPKVLSGPIVRAVKFLPQLNRRSPMSAIEVERALSYILVGAVKKMVIADQIASNVSMIFSQPEQYDGFTLLQGLLGYAVQIYCDFSGYSDMAIGLARLLGFQFPENFQFPFSAVTITEYWRRWHITMSNWFRDYVFFPLEMARKRHPHPTIRTMGNIVATMVLCGIWHGAGWTFVIWGAIHGIAMAAHVGWMAWNPLAGLKRSRAFQIGWNVISRILTLTVVLLSLVYFRCDSVSQAGRFLIRLFSWSAEGTHLISPYIWPAVGAVLIVHVLQNKDGNWAQQIPDAPVAVRIAAYSVLLLAVVALGATDAAPFIYFNF
jgi:alginate O-acetyltransferase complex protein AlgI